LVDSKNGENPRDCDIRAHFFSPKRRTHTQFQVGVCCNLHAASKRALIEINTTLERLLLALGERTRAPSRRKTQTKKGASPNFPLTVFRTISTPARLMLRERSIVEVLARGRLNRQGWLWAIFKIVNPPSRSPLVHSLAVYKYGGVFLSPPSSAESHTRAGG